MDLKGRCCDVLYGLSGACSNAVAESSEYAKKRIGP